MEIYFIRHGDAGDPDPQKYPDDHLRPLTDEGLATMREVGRGLHALGIKFDAMYDSGYLRARQTAEAIAEACGFISAKIESAQALEPEHSPAELVGFLKGIEGIKRVALVGHDPHLSRVASRLIGAAHEKAVEFKKGAVCRVDVDHPDSRTGRLILALPPAFARLHEGARE